MVSTRSKPWCFLAGMGLVGLLAAPGAAATYHVSPRGDDQRDGITPATSWRTVARVNSREFAPGDQILFERGGHWRESLVPRSSGAPGRPIEFGAYGEGPKPRFWGSDRLDSSRFEPVEGGVSRIEVATPVHAVLQDHTFLRSARLVIRDESPARNLDHVRDHPGTWYQDRGVLHVHTAGDLREVTVVGRDDVVHSNGRDHLVLRDLVVDESARFDAGYGFRIMGSADVRLEGCEAYRAGKHHFGVINSTGFVGVNLIAAIAMPDQGAGGASAYVTYSDRTRRGDTSEYHHCTAEQLADPGSGGHYPAFVTHGEGVGSILLDDLTSRGGEIALGNAESGAAIRLHGGRLEAATLAVDGRKIVVDGLTIVGQFAGVSLDGVGNTLQNLVITGGNPGFVGHQAAITEGGQDNLIRFCTIVLDPAAPEFDAVLSLKRRDSRLRWFGNVMISSGTTVRTWFTDFDPRMVEARGNFYGPVARFETRYDGKGASLTLNQWQALGVDRSSIAGDPVFVNAALGDYAPGIGSPLIDALPSDPALAHEALRDRRGTRRPQGEGFDLGAIESLPARGSSAPSPR